jgi:hypothetical protein
MPPPIKLSARSAGWLAHELDAVIAARMVNKPEEEIKELVAQIVERRKEVVA